ncbi:MAG TPA: ribbon-helix-helix protein, CopG family [Candidatus Obscuribacterales bacterium]
MRNLSHRKSKFTASVRQHLVELLDKRAAKLKLNRSDAVEEAIELWLRAQAEQDEETYFATAAKEMNADAKSWNATTTQSARRKWE